MSAPHGFGYQRRKDGSVFITHHGTKAAILRGAVAEKFIANLGGDEQELMARVTGNHKRGNERRPS